MPHDHVMMMISMMMISMMMISMMMISVMMISVMMISVMMISMMMISMMMISMVMISAMMISAMISHRVTPCEDPSRGRRTHASGDRASLSIFRLCTLAAAPAGRVATLP
jgi:membrane protein implicated in regulation of membrane protease activity